MNNKALISLIAVTISAFSYGGVARYFFAYADAQTVDLARRTGNDPLAALGREIPTDRPLMVPAKTLNGGRFKVTFGTQYMSGADPYYIGGTSLHMSFDRTTTNDGPINPQLDDTSFRKLFPANWNNLYSCYSNFRPMQAYRGTLAPVDANNDGIADFVASDLHLRRAYTRAVETGGGMVFSKPIGLGGSFGLPDFPGVGLNYLYRQRPGETFHYFDVEWANDLAAGETYGFAPGETGLDIHTPTDTFGLAEGSATASAPSFGMSYIGARYNLVAAVPEPATLLALSAGLLALRRKRK
jgi:hypothetical protein